MRFACPIRFGISASFLAGLAVLVGCGPSAEQKLIGKWKADIDKEQIEKEAEDDPGAALGAAMMESMNLTMEFKPKNKMEMKMAFGPMNISIEGDWKVVQDNGASAIVELSMKNPNSDETKKNNGTIKFVDADTIELVPKDADKDSPLGERMTLKRVKE